MENAVIGQDRFECGEECMGRKFEASVTKFTRLPNVVTPNEDEISFSENKTGTKS